jgi:hypothetical protein
MTLVYRHAIVAVLFWSAGSLCAGPWDDYEASKRAPTAVPPASTPNYYVPRKDSPTAGPGIKLPGASLARDLVVEKPREILSRAAGAVDIFNTDYKTRPANAPIPPTLSGRGLNGRDLPIGGEDAFRDRLPPDFMPTDLKLVPKEWCYCNQPTYLRREAAESLARMFSDAARQGLTLRVFSGYRDYRHQTRIYRQSSGRNGGSTKSAARPGKSEHALGTTADITSTERYLMNRAFAGTPEGKWLARNAGRYGWKMTVVSGTGSRQHVDEPWHLRYMGTGDPGRQLEPGVPGRDTDFVVQRSRSAGPSSSPVGGMRKVLGGILGE